MQENDTIIPDRESAQGYDEQARLTGWHGAEVVFGLAYEYVHSGEKLLDLGIGSGLSSAPFRKAGLRISGLDGSVEVLEVCFQKGITADLKLHDLRSLPLPYTDCEFDHVICVAVLNSFPDLGGIFAEASRILRPEGIFAFTVEEQKPGQEESYPINRVEVSASPQAETAVRLYRHSAGQIARWLEHNGFTSLKAQEFLAFAYPAEGKDVYFKAYVARK